MPQTPSLLLLPLLGLACAPSAPASAPQNSAATVEVTSDTVPDDPAASPPSAAPPARSACSPTVTAEAEHDYEEGLRLLEESRDGEHYLAVPFGRALDHLRRAAEAGHLEAQARFGQTRFDDLFMADAPRAEQEDEYVPALVFLLVAARRGHAGAAAYIPGLVDLRLDANGKLDHPPPEPLDSLPEPWLVRTLEEAASRSRCPAEGQ